MDEKVYLNEDAQNKLISDFRNMVKWSDKPKVAFEMLSDMLNSFSDNDEQFIKNMERDHRTLQQNFTRMCFKWIEKCASEEYRFDGRNEGSAKISREMIEAFQSLKESQMPDHWKGVKPSQFLSHI